MKSFPDPFYIERYAGLIAQPRSAIIGRKAATSAVARHLSAIRSILRRRLDRLVPLLALSQPAFATAYRNARIVVNSGSKRKVAGEVAPPGVRSERGYPVI